MSRAEDVTAATRTADADAGGYPTSRTALLLIDPYNDFLSEGGKFWPRVEEVAKGVRLLTAMVRKTGIQTFIVPHRRWEPATNPYQLASGEAQAFAKGSWGGEWRPEFAPQARDIVVCCSNSDIS